MFKKFMLQFALVVILPTTLMLSCARPISNQQTPIPATRTVSTSTPQIRPTQMLAASTEEPEQQNIPECRGQGVLDLNTPNSGIPGALVYYDSAQKKIRFTGGKDLQSWDGPSPKDFPSLIGLSPNGKWLAYWTLPAQMHLLSSQGEQKEFAADPTPLLRLVPPGSGLKQIGWPKWINDRVISFGVNNPRPGQPNFYFMAFMDPFSSEWLLLDTYALKGFEDYGRGIPSPDLTRILYIQGQKDGTATLTLVDRDKHLELWSQSHFGNFSIISGVPNSQVAWATDSSKVAFVNNEQQDQSTLSILNRDGELFQISIPAMQAGISYLRWSPDGKYLAIAVSEARETSPSNFYIFSSILIYDQSLGRITSTCPVPDHQDVGDIAWVADQPAIVYHASNGDINQGRLILLDFQTGLSVKIAENVSQFGGWSADFIK